MQEGLSGSDFNERKKHFGSNFRAPPKRTPFCRLFLNTLEDFMLRLLLVCACISIVLDVTFSDPHERSHGSLLSILFF